MRIEDDVKLDFDDVLIRPKRSTLRSRKDVVLERTFVMRNSGKQWTGVPIFAANMDYVGTVEVAEVLQKYKMNTVLTKFAQVPEDADFLISSRIVPSVGASKEELSTLPENPYMLCIDVANGYGNYFSEFVAMARQTYPRSIIIAGNVATKEMTEQLIISGADIVKIGIGSGSTCITRLVTGVGYPQLSAVIECSDAAHGLGGHIMSDGGCKTPGDIAKAFAAGADFVMIGGMLAGHDETSTTFHGMSSKEAQLEHYQEKKDYRASEGKEVTVANRGPLSGTIEDILGGLRSACTYTGAENLKYLSKCTTFVRVNNTHNRVFE